MLSLRLFELLRFLQQATEAAKMWLCGATGWTGGGFTGLVSHMDALEAVLSALSHVQATVQVIPELKSCVASPDELQRRFRSTAPPQSEQSNKPLNDTNRHKRDALGRVPYCKHYWKYFQLH